MRTAATLALATATSLLTSCAGNSGRVMDASHLRSHRSGPGNAPLNLPRAVGGHSHPYPAPGFGWNAPRQYPQKGFYSSQPGY